MSKGSKSRPFSVSQAEYDNRWDNIFCRDLPPESKEDTANKLLQSESLTESDSINPKHIDFTK